MGQVPAKTFNMPSPFGQASDPSVVTKAIAAPQAPLNNFLPLNPGTPAASSSSSTSGPSGAPINPLAGKNWSSLLPNGLPFKGRVQNNIFGNREVG